MKDESPFSAEYDISNITDSQSSTPQQSSTRKEEESDDFIKKIEADYQLSKPRRKLIRARIIP
jgi:hypothetical protein